MPTVALANSFLTAFARIPRSKQKAVQEFVRKFQEDPRAPGLHYEKLRNMRDDRVRTVRIGIDYRAIVLHPERGDVFLLLWVDHHDEAMEWAADRRFDVNPRTGSFQIYSKEEIERLLADSAASDRSEGPRAAQSAGSATQSTGSTAAVATPNQSAGLFAAHDDEVLLELGVPEILLPSIRAIEQPDRLTRIAPYLPGECAEALCWLAEGLPLDEIKYALAVEPPSAPVDVADLGAALEHPDTKRRLAKVDDADELQRMLDQPLAQWRVFLHPSQERLVRRSYPGTVKVTGGAGTGKTVVAMHRARYLARELFREPSDRILFTTYTSNLAKNVAQNLDELCGDEREQIDVVHLHSWAVSFMRTQGIAFDIATSAALRNLWSEALSQSEVRGFDLTFVRQEWELVAQAQNATTRAAYFKASRSGRGRALSRSQRAEIYKVFERFQHGLRERGLVEWIEVIRATRERLETNPAPRLPYRAIVIDEAQDFHAEEWRLLRAMLPEGANDIFLVGDAHQRIYGQRVVLGACGINVRGRRSRRLRVNYRTTEKIRDWAMAVLRGCPIDDLDGDAEASDGYRSLRLGAPPLVRRFETREAERAFVTEKVAELQRAGYGLDEICLVARGKRPLREVYAPALEKAGFPTTILDKDDTPAAEALRLATMHRVKGLEFPVMLLVGVPAAELPTTSSAGEDQIPGSASATANLDDEALLKRSLLFVAATRARDELIVSSF